MYTLHTEMCERTHANNNNKVRMYISIVCKCYVTILFANDMLQMIQNPNKCV